MKFSISVPDHLWPIAQAITGETSPSAVVQALITNAYRDSPLRLEIEKIEAQRTSAILKLLDQQRDR